MKFTRAAHGCCWDPLPPLHNDITELLDVKHMALLHCPLHRCSIGFRSGEILGHLQLPQQGSCHFGGVFGVVIMPFSPLYEGRASCPASEFHSTCWNPCFPQWSPAPQYQQIMMLPPPYLTVARHNFLGTPYQGVTTHAG